MPMQLHICLLILLAGTGHAAELLVGPGRAYATPSAAAAACQDGDTISIDAGTYAGDACAWTRSNLTLRGVGGRAHLEAAGAHAWGKGTWVIAGNQCTVENIEFSGAAVPDLNGAGIRLDGTCLTVRNCSFHDNQEGILTGADPASDIVIEHCEFAANGAGDGYSHNLYIGNVRSLVFRGNYSHHAKVGHNLKTRANANYIIGNRIMDEASGTSSYVVDVPNGGLTFLIGNLIQQGPATSNHSAIIRYGEEGGTNPVQHLYVACNTIVNDYPGSTSFLTIATGTAIAQVVNNIFLGPGTAISGTATSSSHNLITGTDPLVDRAAYDYRPAPGSAAIDAAADPGSAEGQALLPATQYSHPAGSSARVTAGAAPDIGAIERSAGGNTAPLISAVTASPSAVTGSTTSLAAVASDDGGAGALVYSWSSAGPYEVYLSPNGTHDAAATTAGFGMAGTYVLTATVDDGDGGQASGSVTVVVSATPSALEVHPGAATVAPGGSIACTCLVVDQFGIATGASASPTWSVAGGGSIDASGLFTAGAATGGPWTITAVDGVLTGFAQVSVATAPAGGDDAASGASGGACGLGAAAVGIAALALLATRFRRQR